MAFRDVVVLVPGITGSVLSNARGQELWSPTVGAVWRAIVPGGGALDELTLQANGDPGGITATRLVPDVTIVPGLKKIDGYTRVEQHLVNRLRLEPGKNYFPFPYDWRLDSEVTAELLERQAMNWLRTWQAESPAAKLIFVAHSMGGIVCRYFMECLGGWKHTRALVTLGTPYSGSLNAVDFIEHGMKKGIGPFGVDLSPLLRSFPSVYQLLPTYACIEAGDRLETVRQSAVSGNLRRVIPERARLAEEFHERIRKAQSANAQDETYARSYRTIPLVGIEQPTYQSARRVGDELQMVRSLEGLDDGGDGTVPRVSATPLELRGAYREIYAAEMHGSLQNSPGGLANLTGTLIQPAPRHAALDEVAESGIRLDVDDVVEAGFPVTVRARASGGKGTIEALLTNVQTMETVGEVLSAVPDSEWSTKTFDLPAGTWRVQVSSEGYSPVTDLVAVAAS